MNQNNSKILRPVIYVATVCLFLMASMIVFGHFYLGARYDNHKVKFESEHLIFDTVASGTTLHGEFLLSNSGTKPISITEVATSCGCLEPEYSKSPIMPDGNARITISLLTEYESKLPGVETPKTFAKNAVVHFDNHTAPVGLRISGKVLPDMIVHPTQLIYSLQELSANPSQSLTIQRVGLNKKAFQELAFRNTAYYTIEEKTRNTDIIEVNIYPNLKKTHDPAIPIRLNYLSNANLEKIEFIPVQWTEKVQFVELPVLNPRRYYKKCDRKVVADDLAHYSEEIIQLDSSSQEYKLSYIAALDDKETLSWEIIASDKFKIWFHEYPESKIFNTTLNIICTKEGEKGEIHIPFNVSALFGL